jgi:mannose-6-phosphate isomerase-like protein (cupin superfamily)
MAEYNPYSDGVEPGDWTTTVRRVVTGLNDAGESVIVWDEQNPHRNVGHAHPGYVITNIWRTESAPADNTAELRDPWVSDEPLSIGPSATGSVFRYLELPPDTDWRFDDEGREVEPLAFHTTNSIDYAIVLKGEIWAVMDEGETLLRQGDVLIQRGTHHAWSNRSDGPALLAFILIGGSAAAS